ncbi:hypothetical protein SAMN04490370_10310 [Eubacterium ruminantium]|nr:hypothetical protein SAMN04490370_10310 [Eubacterium ruminantium]
MIGVLHVDELLKDADVKSHTLHDPTKAIKDIL